MPLSMTLLFVSIHELITELKSQKSKGVKMITLYKDENKNNKIKETIASLRQTQLPLSFKYYSVDEKIDYIFTKYNLDSREMARKVTWVLIGDYKRQSDICCMLGKEYAMYNA